MEQPEELREVLERVERKILAAGKIYSAMNFAYWLAVMSLFYAILAFFGPSGLMSITYWIGAMVVGVIVSGALFRKIMVIARLRGEKEWRRGVGIAIAASWIAGAIIGFYAIPVLLTQNFGVALLSFIAVSIFGMWLSLGFSERFDLEMIPAFAIPALGSLAAFQLEDATVWAGFVIAAAFSITILLYLYSAFRTIGD
ncbi:hypothetical protein [Geoglobus ahangari]